MLAGSRQARPDGQPLRPAAAAAPVGSQSALQVWYAVWAVLQATGSRQKLPGPPPASFAPPQSLSLSQKRRQTFTSLQPSCE